MNFWLLTWQHPTIHPAHGENKCRMAGNKCRIARNKCRIGGESVHGPGVCSAQQSAEILRIIG
jgi:hypothetical protein